MEAGEGRGSASTPPPTKKHLEMIYRAGCCFRDAQLRAGHLSERRDWLEDVALNWFRISSRNANNMTPAIAMTASSLRARPNSLLSTITTIRCA